MKREQLQRHFVAAMAKHLPPSASTLRLLDLDGHCGTLPSEFREDLDVHTTSTHELTHGQSSQSPADAVLAYDVDLGGELLAGVLDILRPGGRFIAVRSTGNVSEDWLRLLESHGYVRILVEPALDDLGVLIRGEKTHTTDNTLRRIAEVADADANLLDIKTFRGRYVHLLIRQSPNKPVWQMTAREQLTWHALALQGEGGSLLLGFSSLPKAVGFMQELVLAGSCHGINKVGKFSKATADAWHCDVLLNPSPELIRDHKQTWLDIDPKSAAAPDE